MFQDYTQGPCHGYALRWGWRPGIPMDFWVRRAEELASIGSVVLFHEFGTLATRVIEDGVWRDADGRRHARLVDALAPDLPTITGQGADVAETIRAGLVLVARYLAETTDRHDAINAYVSSRLIRTIPDWWLARQKRDWARAISRAIAT